MSWFRPIHLSWGHPARQKCVFRLSAILRFALAVDRVPPWNDHCIKPEKPPRSQMNTAEYFHMNSCYPWTIRQCFSPAGSRQNLGYERFSVARSPPSHPNQLSSKPFHDPPFFPNRAVLWMLVHKYTSTVAVVWSAESNAVPQGQAGNGSLHSTISFN